MKFIRLFFGLAVTGVAFIGCPTNAPNTTPDDDGTADPQPDAANSFIFVVIEAQSTSGLAEILVDDLAGGVTLFRFDPALPPGTRGEACCVSPGVYDVIFEMEGVGFTTFEMQDLLPDTDHIYSVNVTSEDFVITTMRTEPHVED